MIIPAFFIFRPYGTLEIIGKGVAIDILSLARQGYGFLGHIGKYNFEGFVKRFKSSPELECRRIYKKGF
jgi:hypothetical protein